MLGTVCPELRIFRPAIFCPIPESLCSVPGMIGPVRRNVCSSPSSNFLFLEVTLSTVTARCSSSNTNSSSLVSSGISPMLPSLTQSSSSSEGAFSSVKHKQNREKKTSDTISGWMYRTRLCNLYIPIELPVQPVYCTLLYMCSSLIHPGSAQNWPDFCATQPSDITCHGVGGGGGGGAGAPTRL